MIVVASVSLILWLPVPSTQAADRSLFSEADALSTTPTTAPVSRSVPAQATWVDDISSALGSYFKLNYPEDDFAPYLKKLTLVQNAVDRGDQRTVYLEMGAFFTLLTDHSYGISQSAAEELTNFTRMVMPVQEF
jgi:hypothetical protein